jgi:hypothetical protein
MEELSINGSVCINVPIKAINDEITGKININMYINKLSI